MHSNCRNSVYLHSIVRRFSVPDAFVSWSVDFAGYVPPYYDAPVLLTDTKPLWADSVNVVDPPTSTVKWNQLDKDAVSGVTIDRRSLVKNGDYAIVQGLPQNPIGRTGLRGRGLLGRWGPNHAADPIITRWKDNQPDTR